jgi:acyl dehydratase
MTEEASMTNATLPLSPGDRTELEALLGLEVGPTAWHDVTQERVDAFAKVTGDCQWIHVDPARAAASSLGGTIAHGLLTLSLGPALLAELLTFDNFAASLNYGYDRVRFIAPLPVGGRIRMRLTVLDVVERSGAIQVRNRQTFEREDGDRPVAIADSVAHLLRATTAREQ